MSAPAPAPEHESSEEVRPRRVQWMELFFDLLFAAFITQLAQGLHGSPDPRAFLVFAGLFVPAWWAWANMMITVNVSAELSVRAVSLVVLASSVCVGAMAAAAPEGAGAHAWVFALANAGLRLVILPLWLRHARATGGSTWRPLTYNGVTAALWIASVAVPQPAQFLVWALAILLEMLLLAGRRNGAVSGLLRTMSLELVAERLVSFMLIVMGEIVLSVVLGLSGHWSWLAALAALFGFLILAALAWSFLIYAPTVMEEGFRRLSRLRDAAALRDTIMFLPYFLVVGVTMLASGLGSAVAHPGIPLSLGAAVTVGAGPSLFFLTNSLVSLRYGATLQHVWMWATVGTILPLGLIPIGVVLPAAATVGIALLLMVFVVLYTEVRAKRRVAASLSSLGLAGS